MAEELAMLHVLLFAHSLGFQDIVEESDSLEVINMHVFGAGSYMK
jgi:hypothetical protein